MSNLDVVRAILSDSPYCAICGTDLNMHLRGKGNKHVYLLDTDELLCSHKCLSIYRMQSTGYQIFNKQILDKTL